MQDLNGDYADQIDTARTGKDEEADIELSSNKVSQNTAKFVSNEREIESSENLPDKIIYKTDDEAEFNNFMSGFRKYKEEGVDFYSALKKSRGTSSVQAILMHFENDEDLIASFHSSQIRNSQSNEPPDSARVVLNTNTIDLD